MKLLGKDEILAASDMTFEEVDVPEWGGAVRVKSMSGAERDLFESFLTDIKGKDVKQNFNNVRAKLVACTAVDENGSLLFDVIDVAALGKKSAIALNRVFQVAQKLNGIGQDAVDELSKN